MNGIRSEWSKWKPFPANKLKMVATAILLQVTATSFSSVADEYKTYSRFTTEALESAGISGGKRGTVNTDTVVWDVERPEKASSLELDLNVPKNTLGTLKIDQKNLRKEKDRESKVRYELSIEDRKLSFRILENYHDDNNNVTHMAGAVDGGGFVRISMFDENNFFIATIGTGDERYRILSDTKRQNSYYLVDLAESINSVKPTPPRYIPIISKDSHKRLRRLEELHLASNLISDLQPDFVDRSGDHTYQLHKSVFLVGGELGTADVLMEKSLVPAAIEDHLERLSAVTGWSEDVQLEVTKITGDKLKGFQVYFRQLIEDIPVDSEGRIEVEASTGSIESIHSDIYLSQADYGFQKIDLMTREVAEAKALDTVHAMYPDLEGKEFEIESDQSKLVLLPFEKSLTPTWRVFLGYFVVEIDVISGATNVIDRRVHVGNTQLFTDTCRHLGTSSSQEPYCEQSNIKRVYRETSSGKVCYDGSNCTARHSNAYDVINDGEAEWALGDASSCCAGAGGNDNRIGVLIDSQSGASNGTAYYLADARGMLHLPPKSTFNTNNEPAYANDIILHEMAHGMQDAINDSIIPNNSSSVAYAFIEGAAHAFAYQVSRRQYPNNKPHYDSTPWTIGNSLFTPYNIKNSKGFRDFYHPNDFLNINGAVVSNAEIIGNLYYRVSMKSGVTLNDMSLLIVKSFMNYTPNGGHHPTDHDLEDIKRALVSASSGNSTLRSAVNSAISSMENRSSSYPWGYPPPSWVGERLGRCFNNLYQTELRWGSTGADRYRVYGDGVSLVTTGALSVNVGFYLPTTLRVASCNFGPNPFVTNGGTVLSCGSMSESRVNTPSC